MSGINTFKKIIAKSFDLSQLQTSLEEIFRQIQTCPLIIGNLVTGIVLVSGTEKVIQHKLQRQPLGWIVTDNTASAILYRSSWDPSHLVLIPSADTTASVWVF